MRIIASHPTGSIEGDMPGLLLLSLFSTLVLLLTWIWTHQDVFRFRWPTRCVVGVLLLGMLLPADTVKSLAVWLGGVLPGLDVAPSGIGAAAAHVILFALAAFLVGRLRHAVGWVAVGAFLAALAFMTEALQHFSPGRQPSVMDVGFNLAGVLAGLTLLLVFPRLGAPAGAEAVSQVPRSHRR